MPYHKQSIQELKWQLENCSSLNEELRYEYCYLLNLSVFFVWKNSKYLMLFGYGSLKVWGFIRRGGLRKTARISGAVESLRYITFLRESLLPYLGPMRPRIMQLLTRDDSLNRRVAVPRFESEKSSKPRAYIQNTRAHRLIDSFYPRCAPFCLWHFLFVCKLLNIFNPVFYSYFAV